MGVPKVLRRSPEDQINYRKFYVQMRYAKRRGIEWYFTFDEWMKLWKDSGHWHERGYRRGQYVMARIGDKGPYKAKNVRIVTVLENSLEFERTVDYREKISKSLIGNTRTLGRKHSEKAKRLISLSLAGNQHAFGNRFSKSLDAIARTAAAHRGVKRSAEVCANVKKAAQLREEKRRETRRKL